VHHGNSLVTHISVFHFIVLKPLLWLSVDIPAKQKFINQLPNYTPKIVDLANHFSTPPKLAWQPTGELFVVLHCQSHFSSPMWPIENYIQLQKILQLANIKTVWTGGLVFDSFLQKYDLDPAWNIDLQGKTSVMETIYLLQQAACCVIGATGILHLAGWLEVPHIGLFPKQIGLHTGRWKPLGSNGIYLDHESIAKITAESVWTEIQKFIHR
jgi:ADP-heptose:LPS heptosyltransferase